MKKKTIFLVFGKVTVAAGKGNNCALCVGRRSRRRDFQSRISRVDFLTLEVVQGEAVPVAFCHRLDFASLSNRVLFDC